jgi:hypothetical protein
MFRSRMVRNNSCKHFRHCEKLFAVPGVNFRALNGSFGTCSLPIHV